ncbi:hypothetical protein [Caldiplasma sukawensis]
MEICSFSFQKLGNTPEENEDAYSYSDESIAVADGASDSIFSGLWAKSLVDEFVDGNYDLEYTDNKVKFLQNARDRWFNGIKWDELKWNVKNKAITGSYATFISCRFEGEKIKIFSVGDSCFIGIMEKQLYSFPIQDSKAFGITPRLLWSGYGRPLDNREYKQRSDFVSVEFNKNQFSEFMLSTDALSNYVISNGVKGFQKVKENYNMKNFFDQEREKGRIKNDDLTAVIISF